MLGTMSFAALLPFGLLLTKPDHWHVDDVPGSDRYALGLANADDWNGTLAFDQRGCTCS
jgi:hypothetical protein